MASIQIQNPQYTLWIPNRICSTALLQKWSWPKSLVLFLPIPLWHLLFHCFPSAAYIFSSCILRPDTKNFCLQSTTHLLKDFLTPVSFGIKRLESDRLLRRVHARWPLHVNELILFICSSFSLTGEPYFGGKDGQKYPAYICTRPMNIHK